MGISILMLTYKEEENIKILIPAIIENIKKVTDDYEIVVTDSPNSNDKTKEICEQYGVKYHIQEGPNYIDALKTAIKYASKETTMFIDADLSHPAEYIPDIYKTFMTNNADIVIGSRYVKGGKTDDYKLNIVYSKFINFVFQILYGIHGVKDISGGYKMYKTEILKNIDFISGHFEFQIEILLKAKKMIPNLKVIEVPISFKKRWKGTSKRNYFQVMPRFISTLTKLLFYRIINRI